MTTKHGIHVVSYVHTDQGLVNFEDLTPEQKTEAATRIKIDYLNTLYAGKATFEKA